MQWVLIVEDSLDLGDVLLRSIRADGYEARVSVDGRDALRVLRENEVIPKLILLDLMMPVMDGWDFLSEKKLDPRLSEIPVVICSASPRNIPPGIRVLRKPFDIEAVLNMVGEHMDEISI